MAKRIYAESVKKYARENPGKLGIGGASTVGIIFLIFAYLSAQGLIVVHSSSGDMVCAGTLEDPCYAIINFTVKDTVGKNGDIFIYPTEYDPWGRDTPFEFSNELSSWKLQRSWGSGWRDLDLTKGCTGTWCGAPRGGGKYSVVFREGKNYNIRIVGYKQDPSDLVTWSFNPTGQWLPVGGMDFDVINDCVDVPKRRSASNVTEVEVVCGGNASCSSPLSVTSWYTEDYKVEVCTEVGVKKGSKEVMYEQSDKKCLRTNETLCCWLRNDGGGNLESRGGQYRTIIRSGESGTCVNITQDFQVLSSRSDFAEVKV